MTSLGTLLKTIHGGLRIKEIAKHLTAKLEKRNQEKVRNLVIFEIAKNIAIENSHGRTYQ